MRDSHLVERLRRAGCVVVGKTNTPEYGWTACTDNALFGYTRNPWDLEHSAGGSSGGSAAAVASGMVPLATGSDGGGSIRIPSALCGLSGFKPSFGRVPAGGPSPPGWLHLSSKGPMARRIADVALALDAVVGPEQDDLTSLPRPEASWLDAVADPRLPARVGVVADARVRHPSTRGAVGLRARARRRSRRSASRSSRSPSVFDADPVIAWLDARRGVHRARPRAARRAPALRRAAPPAPRARRARRVASPGVEVVRAYDEFHR